MKLYSEDFFITPQQHIAVEPRVPQPIFPEHTHDFSEIFW
ncbi:transcriptional activator RhaS [Providencia rettgeri Dmel1]|nr:transcriptional activator RhaS [Providencia rettgeri Dmel1]